MHHAKKALKKMKPRDYGFAIAGALIVLLGASLMQTVEPKHKALTAHGSGITIPWIPENVKRWEPTITEMAAKYDLDPNLVAIIMTIESGGNQQAKSHVGAQGLMQVMPPTAQDIAAKHLKQPTQQYDIYDPKTNIEFGVAYLAYLRDEFGSSSQGPSWNTTAELVAAGYNGGPGAASSLEKGNGVSSSETAAYSRDVLNMWRERNSAHSPTYERWLERGGSRLVNVAQ